MDIRENAIFGRYTREECGLPPRPCHRPGWRFYLSRAVFLIAALLGVGWLAGSANARYREAVVTYLPALVARSDTDEASRLLERGRIYAAALPDRAGMRRNLALAATVAADRSRRRLGYYGNIRTLLSAAGHGAGGATDEVFINELSASGVYAEIDDYQAAFSRLERAEQALEREKDESFRKSGKLLLANSKAYLMATAPEGSGRDPDRALHLAELMITSKDTLPGGGHASGSAALLDTLASAYHAAGLEDKAVTTQSLALGLADSQSLDIYIRHYDEFMGGVVSSMPISK